ncbi:MAG: N-acetylmuramoyl-L-alanine amidase [Clostridia bacterium]|nr:N-acetylmuramoyl-L-alanine amidase [Clostridia bacterium]
MAIRIYIDQGHNPQNPNAGAEGNGLREQDLVYPIGVELAARLNANPEFEARLSRPTPTTTLGTSNSTSLRLRVQDANAWGADYFISLHTNAAESAAASGSEGFAFSRPSAAFSLGEDILRRMTEVTGLRNRGMFVRTNLYVLRKTAMPAVLIELGFITNPGDAFLMRDNPALFAEGIYQGIVEYTLG